MPSSVKADPCAIARFGGGLCERMLLRILQKLLAQCRINTGELGRDRLPSAACLRTPSGDLLFRKKGRPWSNQCATFGGACELLSKGVSDELESFSLVRT